MTNMKHDFINTKEFVAKFVISALLIIAFSIMALFSSPLERALGLEYVCKENETASENLSASAFKVNYLSVGQGNCAIVELPDGKTMIIDGGSDFYGEKICKFLQSRGITVIDYLIASHADADHIGGLNFLFDKFEIVNIFRPMQIAGRNVLMNSSSGQPETHYVVSEHEDLKSVYETYGSKRFDEVASQRYCDFIENIYKETYTAGDGQNKSNVTVFYDGLKILGNGYEFEFFAPLKTSENVDLSLISNTNGFMTKIYSNDSSNNSSAVMMLNIFGKKFFFSGDASAATQFGQDALKFEETDFVSSLTTSEKVRLAGVDVYLVAHHGSENSTSSLLLDVIKPKFAVVSAGANIYGHPSEQVVERLDACGSLAGDGIIKTGDSGDALFAMFGDKLMYSTESAAKQVSLTIPFWLLCVIFLVSILAFVINFKPKRQKDLTAAERV